MHPAAAVSADGENVPSVTQALHGKVYLTNLVGQKVLEYCDGSHGVDEIVRAVAAEFACDDLTQVEQDVNLFLADAETQGVIEWRDD